MIEVAGTRTENIGSNPASCQQRTSRISNSIELRNNFLHFHAKKLHHYFLDIRTVINFYSRFSSPVGNIFWSKILENGFRFLRDRQQDL